MRILDKGVCEARGVLFDLHVCEACGVLFDLLCLRGARGPGAGPGAGVLFVVFDFVEATVLCVGRPVITTQGR